MDSCEDCSVLFLQKKKKKLKNNNKNNPHISFQEKKFQDNSARLIAMGKMEVGIHHRIRRQIIFLELLIQMDFYYYVLLHLGLLFIFCLIHPTCTISLHMTSSISGVFLLAGLQVHGIKLGRRKFGRIAILSPTWERHAPAWQSAGTSRLTKGPSCWASVNHLPSFLQHIEKTCEGGAKF